MPGPLDPDPLTHALDAARRRLERMGARCGGRVLDLDDLVQETAAAVYGSPGLPADAAGRALWIAVAVNKARDELRAAGRAPRPAVGDEAAETQGPGAVAPADRWAGLCGSASSYGDDMRRVLTMRQGLELDWTVISFVDGRRSEAARSLYYRGRDGLRDENSA